MNKAEIVIILLFFNVGEPNIILSVTSDLNTLRSVSYHSIKKKRVVFFPMQNNIKIL